MHINKREDIFILSYRYLGLIILFIRPSNQVIDDLFNGTSSWMDAEIGLVISSIEVITRH